MLHLQLTVGGRRGPGGATVESRAGRTTARRSDVDEFATIRSRFTADGARAIRLRKDSARQRPAPVRDVTSSKPGFS